MIEAPKHTMPVRISSTARPDLVGWARPASGESQTSMSPARTP
jgi:hypothetical protein